MRRWAIRPCDTLGQTVCTVPFLGRDSAMFDEAAVLAAQEKIRQAGCFVAELVRSSAELHENN